MKTIMVVAYIGAMVVANLIVAALGPWVSPINSFVLIGCDLALRDLMHDRFTKWQMLCVIIVGGLLTYALNPSAATIAIASACAFAGAALTDWGAYHLLRKRAWFTRSNGSNAFGAAVDSVLFPTLAFGTFMPIIIAGQYAAKMGGGAFWSWVFAPKSERDAVREWVAQWFPGRGTIPRVPPPPPDPVGLPAGALEVGDRMFQWTFGSNTLKGNHVKMSLEQLRSAISDCRMCIAIEYPETPGGTYAAMKRLPVLEAELVRRYPDRAGEIIADVERKVHLSSLAAHGAFAPGIRAARSRRAGPTNTPMARPSETKDDGPGLVTGLVVGAVVASMMSKPSHASDMDEPRRRDYTPPDEPRFLGGGGESGSGGASVAYDAPDRNETGGGAGGGGDSGGGSDSGGGGGAD